MPNLFYHVIITIGLRKCSCVSKDMSKDGGQLTAFFVTWKVCEFCKYAKIKSLIYGLFELCTVLFHKVKNGVLEENPVSMLFHCCYH